MSTTCVCQNKSSDQDGRFDVLMMSSDSLTSSREYLLGLRELRKRLPIGLKWYHIANEGKLSVEDFLGLSDAPWWLVILNSAIGVSDNLIVELSAVLSEHGETITCVLPSDPRGFAAGVNLDYANRSGFDRFVQRLTVADRFLAYDARVPWLYMVRRKAIERLLTSTGNIAWADVPAELGSGSVIAQHVFVHSFADYYANDRAEMLSLVPAGARTLLDVGGGEGHFARAFAAKRAGKATLLESNPLAANTALKHGVDVLVGDFIALSVGRQFDCVALLDVLEHLDDPLAALHKAHQLISPKGTLLLSVPNVGHWSVVFDLWEGRFDYQPVGILCNTHKVFFTRRSLEDLLQEAGFKVRLWQDVKSPMPDNIATIVDAIRENGAQPDQDSLQTAGFYILAEKYADASL